ncbi:hypothetical protein Cni_G04998 [Canna indica]|uniref:Uncharacterized protein n=1 Tax=Canna indica TaxID=4628 RepID=A0AAQ3JUF2_9LILI|nr:hypothetical protein Cni_G04998 [Canna indica]
MRRGFRSVSPTVIYSFMQASGITNVHLITCYRFEECTATNLSGSGEEKHIANANHIMEERTYSFDLLCQKYSFGSWYSTNGDCCWFFQKGNIYHKVGQDSES